MAKQRTREEKSGTRLRWWRPAFFAAVVVTAALLALPWGIKQVLQNWLLNNGADQASIADVDLNLFTGTAALKGVRVETGARAVMAAKSFSVDFNVWPLLLRRELIVNRGDMDGMRLEIERLPEGGWQIGSIRIGDGTNRSAQRKSWLLRIDQLETRDSAVMYRSPVVSSTITIGSASLKSFTNAPNPLPASLIFKGKIDEAPAELEIRELRLSPRLELAGKVALRELPIGYVAGLFRVQPESVGGTVDASGKLHITDREQQGMMLTYQGELALAGGKTHGKRLQLDVDQLGWTGNIEYLDKTRQAPWALQLDGRLRGRDLEMRFVDQPIEAQHREIELNGKVAVSRLKGKINIKAQAALQAAGTTLIDTRASAPFFSLDTITAGSVETDGAELITINDFAAEGLRVPPGQLGETVTELRRLGFKTASIRELETLEAAKIKAIGFQVGAADTSVVLLTTEQVDVDDVTAKGMNHVDAGQIDLRGLSVLANPQTGAAPVANLKGAQITDLAWHTDQGINMAVVQLQDLHARLRRDANQQWEIDQLLATGMDPAQQRETPTATRQTETEDRAKTEPRGGGRRIGPQFRVGELRLEGSNDVRFEDQGVRPPFRTTAVISELRVTGIDTGQPDTAASITLAGDVGQYGKIRLHGTVKPFLPIPELEMELEARDLELVPLSSYTVPLIGHAMERGQLRIASTTRITGGRLDSQNKLRLAKIKVKAVSPEVAKQLEADIGMRLDRALSLLSDKAGNVKLSVPIVGELGNTKVGLEDAIGTAIRGALGSGLSALGYILLPQISFTKGIFKGLTKKKMAPIEFEAGRAVLDQVHQKALDTLAKQLQKQATRTVQLCPVVTLADVGALFGDTVKGTLLKNRKAGLAPQQEDGLIALGYDRAVAIKDRLVHQDDIAADRIFTCAPQAARDADAKPRVELKF